MRNPANARRPKIDCFYVYPTISNQATANADRSVDPELIAIAEAQAARYSRACRVYAPVYRQLTLVALTAFPEEEQRAAIKLAYADVRAAWRDYLENYNHGRGVVLIGHSQGTIMLTQLLRSEIEPRRAIRKRLVSAILLGGNVTVRQGSKVGGSFRRTPPCRSQEQIGCVIAFSTYNETPPDDTRFGRHPGRFAEEFGMPTGPNQRVVCTNPAALGSSESAPLRSLSRSEPFPPGLFLAALTYLYRGAPPSAETPWISPQDHYTGRCVRENEANVLMIDPVAEAKQLRPSPDDTWGLHLIDANIALGNLVTVARNQIKAYLAG